MSVLRRFLLMGLAALTAVVALLGTMSPAAAQDIDRRPGRLLVISVPGLTWAHVADRELPELRGFFDGAALADLAPRGVSPRSGPGDAYLTISAGARATTERTVDGQVLGLEETSSGSAAGEIFSRRTGVVADGEHVALAWPALLRANAREPYDAVLGLLAETLEEGGVSTSAIGNADGTDSVGQSYERQVGLAFAETDGVVTRGAIERDLLVDDPGAPFGVRLDHQVVLEHFAQDWAAAEPTGEDGGGVVLVEASDLARTLRYRPMVGSERFARMWDAALLDTDRLVGELLAQVDPERDAVLVLAPYNRVGSRDLTAVALKRPGTDPGYLKSASTQRSGFLTLVDIGPTILDTFDIERPVDMEGRQAELVDSSASLDERIEHLVSLNEASRFREKLLTPTTVAVVIVLALVAAGTVIAVVGRLGPRWRRALAFTALVDLAVFPASYLARLVDLEDLGIGFYWVFVVVVAGAIAGAASVFAARRGQPRAGLVLVLVVIAVVLVGDVMTGSRLSLSAAFGYSPTGNSRLYGISNYSYGQLAAAVCLLAAFLASRGDDRGRRLALGLLVATLVVLGVPIWGSDVGGILAFTPAILAFGAIVLQRRIRLRTVVAGGLAAAVAVTLFGLLDLARPAEERAHLGRLFERIGDEGLGPLFSIMERKLLANVEVSTSSFWVAAIPLALAFWWFLVKHPSRRIEPLREQTPVLGAGLLAALVAAFLGSLVNDSGAIVGGVAGTVITASLAYLVLLGPGAPPAATDTGAGP
jgi:hypothetical protein